MNEELRQYYFIVERPVGSQIWTFAAMACDQEAANSKAIAICNERKTCTRIVSAMLPKQADSGFFYALLCDNQAFTQMCAVWRFRKGYDPRPDANNAVSEWTPADKELPGNPRCVLATDGEAHFVACYEAMCPDPAGWSNAHTSEDIDSVITHWMELPEVPNE